MLRSAAAFFFLFVGLFAHAAPSDDRTDELWSRLRALMPQTGQDVLSVPGADVRGILERFIPNVDEYMQALVDNLDHLEVRRGNGKIIVEAKLTVPKFVVPLKKEEEVGKGRVYAVKFYRDLRFELSMDKDGVLAKEIRGFKLLVKLPFLPDGVYPRAITLNNNTETLTIHAKVVGKLFNVVATADVKGRKFNGVEWLDTLGMNLDWLFNILIFTAVL